MKKISFLFVILLLISSVNFAQEKNFSIDTAVVTEHIATIQGQEIPYTATAGMQPVFNKEGEPTASLFYVYYKRSDVENQKQRPLLISFNGGPGSASVWMHIGYTGPKRLKVSEEGFPVQPYGMTDNPYSVLDVADILYINPANTGYSRVLDPKGKKKKVDRDEFFGVNADIEYLAQWINTFISRHDRWLSPKYLIGESYGTTRVSGLALELQNQQWMYLNGIILVSPTHLGIKREGPMGTAINLPYFTAAAWYHEKLAPELQQQKLTDLLPKVEHYAINTLLPALAKGGSLKKERKHEIAQKMGFYSGISKKAILNHNLRVPTGFFWKELLRKEGYTIGRLDSRYLGIDRKEAGNYSDYFPELTAWLNAFTPAINYYLDRKLNFQTELTYNMFGDVHPWDSDNNNTGENLRQAMAQNPNLEVLIQSGYFDGATTYFDAKYTMWQLDPSGKMQDRLHLIGYPSGHMMYLRKEDLKKASQDLRNFIQTTLPKKGKPIKYEN